MAAQDKINILVVDDLPDKLLALGTALEGLGANVVTARSGGEALRRLLEQDFAVILLDVNMPDMDGLETAALIRKRKKTERTPIIFLTAFDDERRLAQGYSLGAVDYILSPVPAEVLRTKIGVFVDLFRMNEQVKRQAEERVALAREQAARAAAEEEARRLQFLAEAGDRLGRSLDAVETLRAAAGLAVPFLGDFAVAVLVEPCGSWRTETAGEPGTAPFGEARVLPAGMADLIRRALDEGRTLQGEMRGAVDGKDAPESALVAPRLLGETGWGEGEVRASPSPFLPDPSLPRGDGRLGDGLSPALRPPPAAPQELLALPFKARGRVLGVLLLGGCGRPYTPADRTLAEDLACRAAAALENARLYREIQDQDHCKTEFLAMLAHELRNPLAPIRNAVQILRRGDEASRRWASDVIDRQVTQMVRLVDDLLDISRITRGKVTLKTQPTDAAAAVAAAVETSQPLIDARRHELVLDLPSQPLWLTADPARLAQVLANLLNNAAKYTEEGGRITLAVERAGGDAVFRVRDTGVGIAAEMLPRVFDLFTQIDRSLDRSQGGLGIGLTLVRRLVEMHGGRVDAFSGGTGRGSEFVVRLRALAAAAAKEEPTNGTHEPPADAGGLRVLVVDDNRDLANSLALLLEQRGYRVRTAYDGNDALDVAEAFDPDAVVLDIGLPRLNGYEAGRQLRARPRAEPLMLVALTGYGQEDNRLQAQAAGFDHHVVKPAGIDELDRLLSAVVQARSAKQDCPRPALHPFGSARGRGVMAGAPPADPAAVVGE